MDTTCLDHILSDRERQQFNDQGYLIVEDAVSHDQLQRISDVCDRLLKVKRDAGLASDKAYSHSDIIGYDPVFVEMIDSATTFTKVWGILGWNIYLYHSHLDVTPPAGPNRSADGRTVAWHQDSMRVNDEIESSPRPRLSLKIGYFISDVSQPDRGNTLIVPGSHLQDETDVPADGKSSPPGALPVCVPPGAAVIIDRRLWHSRSINHSPITRKVLWMGYSYRWLRPKDEMTVEHLYPHLDPIQRQILGDRMSNNGFYAPADDDVPLRSWLSEFCPAAADGAHADQRQSYRPDIAGAISGNVPAERAPNPHRTTGHELNGRKSRR